jgi:hypothetical protein
MLQSLQARVFLSVPHEDRSGDVRTEYAVRLESTDPSPFAKTLLVL